MNDIASRMALGFAREQERAVTVEALVDKAAHDPLPEARAIAARALSELGYGPSAITIAVAMKAIFR